VFLVCVLGVVILSVWVSLWYLFFFVFFMGCLVIRRRYLHVLGFSIFVLCCCSMVFVLHLLSVTCGRGFPTLFFFSLGGVGVVGLGGRVFVLLFLGFWVSVFFFRWVFFVFFGSWLCGFFSFFILSLGVLGLSFCGVYFACGVLPGWRWGGVGWYLGVCPTRVLFCILGVVFLSDFWS